MEIENIKVGDLVVCHYRHHVGIGYGKVVKLYELRTKREYQEYGPIITGMGEANSKLEITVQFVGYDLREGDSEDDLGEVIEVVDEFKVLDPHSIYRVITEDEINHIKGKWETLMRNKLDFLYKNVNRPSLGGRKIINQLKIT